MNITFINRMMGIKFGGGENFDLNMARALKKRGHNIRFIVGLKWNKLSLPMYENEFDEVVYIKTPYLRDIHYKVKPTNILNKIISAGALELDLRLFENAVLSYLKNDTWSDIYQICGLPRIGALLDVKRKNAIKQQFKTIVRWPGPPSKIKLKYMKQCDVNFANGDALKIIREKLCPDIKEVNLGIDIEKFRPIIKKDKQSVNFLFVGRIVPIKNIPFLIEGFIEAYKENNNIILNIIGEGDKKEVELVSNLAKKYLSIKFLGKKSGNELVEQYKNSDVFILTSNYDNYPNVVFEAMASGLPVIGTNVGGIPSQVIDKKTGYLVQPNNIEQLKNRILELASNKEMREEFGRAGRERVEQEFSWDKSAEQLEKIYKGIVL
ncbi:glycosyltransferase family 4 protein [Aliarcobacter butzleri]|uniref:glycosyltransferase family 4 protein n=1 Tax=Aliarcobacter butzleri TaxID=28197 RepID=UPI001EDE919D|nr:glycosyltransferase family 4 protein [Aliarcobacter butzleri]MCG3681422.1 glycosyltransferase family 4 protein [Aliarcobacter butzleri]